MWGERGEVAVKSPKVVAVLEVRQRRHGGWCVVVVPVVVRFKHSAAQLPQATSRPLRRRAALLVRWKL